MLRHRRFASAAFGTALAASAACSEARTASTCGPIIREALDPAYVVHVLGEPTDVTYRSEPPTSGPHQPGPEAGGVLARPLSRPRQVGILEQGGILIQHLPDLASPAVEQLESLAGPGVVVAPNADLPAPIVATAWTYKRTCDAVDLASLRQFVAQRGGKGPED